MLSEDENNILSVQETETAKMSVKNIVSVGILKNLQPNMPFSIKSDSPNTDVIQTYTVLKHTTFTLCEFITLPELRPLILPESLKAILVSLYQIAFCPLLKPGKTQSGFSMTQELYQQLLREQEQSKALLDQLCNKIHPSMFVKETMIIFQENAPVWFKKSVSQTLTNVMRSKRGVESIALALLDGTTDDSTRTWKSLEIITKLLMCCTNFPDFKDNIAKQIVELLARTAEHDLVFERIFMHFTKTLYFEDKELCLDVFVRRVVSPFVRFTYKEHKLTDGLDITKEMQQNVRILHELFHLRTGATKKLPVGILQPIFSVIFRFYCITFGTQLRVTSNELKDVLLEIFKAGDKFSLFDLFIFNIPSDVLIKFRGDVVISVDEGVMLVKCQEHVVSYPVSDNAEMVLEILKNQDVLLVCLFGYLLNCLSQREKYFPKSNTSLLNVENEFMNDYFERSLTVYKLLSDLSGDDKLQKEIVKNPDSIIKYIKNVLDRTLELKTHQTTDYDSEGFQSVFTIIMILQSLVSNSKNLGKDKTLNEPLRKISEECSNEELKNLIGSILEDFEDNKPKPTRYKVEDQKTELDKAIDDVCDPLLPVRGHGLMTLAKLVEKKDKSTLERKQYVLNIFQVNFLFLLFIFL